MDSVDFKLKLDNDDKKPIDEKNKQESSELQYKGGELRCKVIVRLENNERRTEKSYREHFLIN